MELILIRHGLPEKVINQDGTPADPPLSEEGLKQAELVANWLEHEQIDKLYASPMRRAVQTAEPLAKVKGLDIELREGVAEYDRKSDLYIPVEQLKELDYDRWKKLMTGEIVEADFPEFAKAVISALEAIIDDGFATGLAQHPPARKLLATKTALRSFGLIQSFEPTG